MEQICVAWMSLKRVALKIYFSIKGANDILCCDPESSFFNAVFRADINDLWERLLTLLLMKLNDGMYAGRDFNQLLHDFKIINYNLLSHVFRLTHVSQSKKFYCWAAQIATDSHSEYSLR